MSRQPRKSGIRSKKNKPWISGETFKAPLQRRKLKETINTSRSTRIKSNLEAKYRLKDKEIKRLARRDKRKFVNDMATKVEEAACSGDMKTLFSITKQLCNENNPQGNIIRDKSNNSLTEDKLKRWIP